jgi:transitional endoplasmic reticulum ATPase
MNLATVNKLVKLASIHANNAVEYDKNKEYEYAIEEYIKAAEILNRLIKVTDIPAQEIAWEKRAKEYTARAKKLKTPQKETEEHKSTEKNTLKELNCTEVGDFFDPDKNKLSYDSLAGMSDVKAILQKAINWPLKYPKKMEEHGISATKGILFVGPPGCGKTFLVKCAAGEYKISLLVASPSVVYDKYVGETPKAIKRIFKCGSKLAPSIIFIDEVDKLLPDPSRNSSGTPAGDQALSTFQQEMDGAASGEGYVVIMATNDPENIHPALTRTGRVSYRILINPPDEETRAVLFKLHLKAPKITLETDVNYEELAKQSEPIEGWYYSASDIAEICRRAKEKRFEEVIKTDNDDLPMSNALIQRGLKKVKRSISPKLMARYKKWADNYES